MARVDEVTTERCPVCGEAARVEWARLDTGGKPPRFTANRLRCPTPGCAGLSTTKALRAAFPERH